MVSLIKKFKLYKAWKYQFPKLDNEQLPLMERALLASTLITKDNKPNLSFVKAMDYYINFPIHTMSYLIVELNRYILELSETRAISIAKSINIPDDIRLDKWIVGEDNSYYKGYSLYEGYVICSKLINDLYLIKKTIDADKSLHIADSYIERRCDAGFRTFIIMTSIMMELYHKKL